MAIVQQARRVRGVDRSIASLASPPIDGDVRMAKDDLDSGSGDHETGDMALDQSELATLVQRYQAPTWRYLRLLGADTHEADDLMQEAFVVCAERLRAGEKLLSPAAFLRGVARNLLLGGRRRDRRRPPTVSWLDAVDEFVTEQPAAIEDGRIDALRLCVQRLQGRVRQAVQWHHLEGMSREEAARRLGIGLHGLKSLLSRARESLRECVDRAQKKEQS
ncbi:MAG: RNA polymerase sigma-70 factor (ECF subfamily) [Planctomycetota bacterium]|jgi:RNA polymerase sigma-70 factor (ECF subfamily)